MAHIKHGENEYEIPEGATAEETISGLQMVKPELANAKLEKDGSTGNWIVKTSFGNKG